MFDEPHLTDRSGIQHSIGPASHSPSASQHEPDRADRRDPPSASRTWQKPPHIVWRRLRALFARPDTQTEAAYGSPSRYGYERNAAPSSWRYGFSIVLALLALACATLSSGLFHKRDDAVALALQSTGGTITSAEPISSVRPRLPSHPALPSTPPKPTPPSPTSLSPSLSQPLPSAGQARPTARVATRQKVETPAAMSHPRAQIDLQVARADMDKNNLTTARAVLSRVLVEQPNNIDAIKLNADLEDREFKRNATLLAARSCAARDQWTCVWRDAGNALVIDASSAEAKQLLTQAMWQSELNSRTGATPPLGVNRVP